MSVQITKDQLEKAVLSLLFIGGYVFYAVKIRINPPEHLNVLYQELGEKNTDEHKKGKAAFNIGYSDGEFTGANIDAFYGNVQVAAVISGGKIIDIKILEYPKHHSYSRQINPPVLEELIKETLEIQSDKVDTVTGATHTSNGYISSLGNALNKAKTP